VQRGRYKFYAELFADPNNVRPFYDIAHRSNQTSGFASLYAPNYPRLSLQTSWVNDPQASFARVEAGAYTDLQYAAYVDIGTAAMTADRAGPSAALTPEWSGMSASRVAPTPSEEPRITREQLEAVRAVRGKTQRTNALPGARRTAIHPSGLRPIQLP
jgi:hypothetical protein